jgi:hypothetical protein|tara:strand:+ start:351 stop:476 length:126 start_codon:yes stop_codon:yes gene_type:complete
VLSLLERIGFTATFLILPKFFTNAEALPFDTVVDITKIKNT